MNFVLLWIDALLVSLLWVATLAALVGRIKRRWVRGMLVPVVFGIPLFLLAGFVFAASAMKFYNHIEPNWFTYSVSLLAAYLVGTSLILRQARRRKPGLAPAAATWPRGPLSFAWLMAVAVGYMTLLNMDLAIRARCALQSVEVNSVYLATLPAITFESQNAAPLYEKAFASLKENQDQEALVTNPPTGNREDEDFDPKEPAMISFLNQQAGTLALLRKAGALPACRFDQDLQDPVINAATFSNLNAERNAANVLNMDAREEIARGHVAAAIADADAILGMGRQFGQRPLLIAALVAIGIDDLGNKTLEQSLPFANRKDELAGLHLEQRPFLGRTFQQALRSEERFGLALYGNLPSDHDVLGSPLAFLNTQLWSSRAGPVGMFFRVYFLDSDVYMRLMQNIQELSTQPYYTARGKWDDVCALKSGRGLLTSILIPSLSRAFETCARVEARDACAQTAVAMTKYRLDHGSLPTHLADLVPNYLEAVPLDPFDGKPLRLAIKSDRWIIYSVGPDLVDHGGVEPKVKQKGDVIFTLKVAKAQATSHSH